ncbi:MAG: hypothetical protein IPG39_13320 [Bacteroidetes bacterium]|nr:hypothetical protein [Bacteroidota bacterium]
MKDFQSGSANDFHKFDSLRLLHNAAVVYIDFCRYDLEKIFESSFKNILLQWGTKLSNDKFFIITFGYSKAVRQVLKNSLNHNREDRNYKVIVLSSENERKIDSRQIKYHLTEQTGKNLNSVFVSNPEFIVPLTSDDCKY